MNHKSLRALIALNVVLLVGLALTALMPPQRAQAQAFAAANYIMVSGRVTGRNQQSAIYIIELNTARLAAVMYNSSNNSFEIHGGRRIADDLPR